MHTLHFIYIYIHIYRYNTLYIYIYIYIYIYTHIYRYNTLYINWQYKLKYRNIEILQIMETDFRGKIKQEANFYSCFPSWEFFLNFLFWKECFLMLNTEVVYIPLGWRYPCPTYIYNSYNSISFLYSLLLMVESIDKHLHPTFISFKLWEVLFTW